MLTNPAARRVLCFGDSNTHGAPSDDPDYVRLGPDVRWTGRLQRLLGDDYDVIEEGLSGRTTDVEYDDRPGCNGRPYFLPCLLSHSPLDVVVVMLGSNDLKVQFGRSPDDIAGALHGYVDDVAAAASTRDGLTPTTVLVSPIHVDDSQRLFEELTLGDIARDAAPRSRALAATVQRVAQERGVIFADAAAVATAGDDGLHLSRDSHEALGRLMATTIGQALEGQRAGAVST